MPHKNFSFSIPIHYLGLFLICILVVILGFLGWYTNQKISNLEFQSELRNERLAHEELKNTISKLLETTKILSIKFSVWDETVQQIHKSTYYKYWQVNRVLKSGFTPEYYDAIELYDREGMPLSKLTEENMPLKIVTPSISAYVVLDKDHIHLYQQANIYENDNILPIGFLVIKVDVNEVLHQGTFRYLDIHKLKFIPTTNKKISTDELIEYFNITAITNYEILDLQELFNSTLLKISTVSLSVFLLFLSLVLKYLGIPLGKLSHQIDLLGERETIEIKPKEYNFISIAEFDKVHDSLNDYHDKLTTSEKELRESELRIRTVLETVPDAMITLDGDFKILSINPAAEHLYGYFQNAIQHKHVDVLLSKESVDKFHHAVSNSYFEEQFEHDESKKQFFGCHQDGHSFLIECSLTNIILSGEKSYLFVVKDITERKQIETRLTHLANYDSLTGLSNRALFSDRLEQALVRARRKAIRLGLLFIDLDRFKLINDTHGHQIGDLLLQTVAKRITSCIREGDTVSRLSGDEFTIIVEDIEHEEDSAIIAKNILIALRKPFNLQNNEMYISASIGIATYPEENQNIDDLIKNADTAMYRAKELGGDKYQYFTVDLNLRAEERLSLENKLRNALEKNLLSLQFQPRINIKDNCLSSVEALIRLDDPDTGFIEPDKFIPVLEETGLIHRCGEWVIQTACQNYMKWQDLNIPNLRISVNISAYQFLEKNFVDMIFGILDENKMAADKLEIEITESLLVDNIDEVVTLLYRLHDRGIKISIDDFGTGYSSLSYLKKFPIDILKIDRSFVSDISTDHDDAIIVETIIAMARSLKLNITAEGVETREQYEFLAERDCDEIQGYFFSKPLTSDELIVFIKNESWKKRLL